LKFAPPKLSEANVTDQVVSFMQAKGWRTLRMQRTIVPGQFSTCEPGTADFLFVRYLNKVGVQGGHTLALWVELKRPNARMRCKCLENAGTRKRCTMCDQKNWQQRERARGATVWSGVSDIDWFMEQYQKAFGWLHVGDQARGQLDLLRERS
jgi:hypothetical protein